MSAKMEWGADGHVAPEIADSDDYSREGELADGPLEGQDGPDHSPGMTSNSPLGKAPS